MSLKPLRLIALACATVTVVVATRAADLPIVAKARSFLGPDATLDAVKSIHFTGTLTTSDPKEPAKQTRAQIDIIFQKPEQQLIKATSDKLIEITALDDYDAWQRQEDPTDKSKPPQIAILGRDPIRRLRANTWENFAFFRSPPGGSVDDQGPAKIDGIDCEKVAFVHGPGLVFYRYFDRATGRLVYTETESGETIREQGEIKANGIHFARTIITTTKLPNGLTQTVTINFDNITVNDNFDPKLFAVPAAPH